MRKYLSIVARQRLLCISFLTLALALLVGSSSAFADEVTFENIAGPSLFGNPASSPSYSFGDGVTATFSGGTVLTDTTNLPADETSVYGTCSPYYGSVCPDYSQTLTISFNQNITNFIMDLYNGVTTTDTFTASDNLGNSVTDTIAANVSSGNAMVEFAAAGDQVTITTTDPNWDFFIDNVQFNVPLVSSTPEPGTMGMLGAGLLSLLAFAWGSRRFGYKMSN
jgi:hypothetical protein